MASKTGLYYPTKEELDEILTAEEDRFAYSTTEKSVGTWVDEQPIYRKTINFGALPGSTTDANATKTVSHGISNLQDVVRLEGIASDSSGRTLPIPYASVGDNIALESGTTGVTISVPAHSDRTTYKGYVTIWYTKAETDPGEYGRVFYTDTRTSTRVKSVLCTSAAEFNSLVGTVTTNMDTVTINGVTLSSGTSTNANVIKGVAIGSEITSIPNYFMKGCTYLNMALTIPSTVTTIGTYFFAACSAFNSTLTLPSSITSIGSNFMQSCIVFNKSLTLPSSITSIGISFLRGCNNFTGPLNVGSLAATVASTGTYTLATTSQTAASYTTGITIKGSTRAAWIARFPNNTSSPYRKLVDGGA